MVRCTLQMPRRGSYPANPGDKVQEFRRSWRLMPCCKPKIATSSQNSRFKCPVAKVQSRRIHRCIPEKSEEIAREGACQRVPRGVLEGVRGAVEGYS